MRFLRGIIESLDLYNNDLASLPIEARQLKSLKKVFIKDFGLLSTAVRDVLPGA